MLRGPAVAPALLSVTSTLTQHAALREPVIVILVKEAWQAAYELAAHVIGVRKVQLLEAAIQALAAGPAPTDLPAPE